jgi:hypothetical protein
MPVAASAGAESVGADGAATNVVKLLDEEKRLAPAALAALTFQ